MSRRRGRPGGGSRIGSELGEAGAGPKGALLLAVAVVLGIVLLQAIDSSPAGPPLVASTTTTTAFDDFATLPSTVEPTATTRPPGEVKVLVANGTRIRGAAARVAEALKTAGYGTLTPTDAAQAVATTSVQYAPGYQADAEAVAVALGRPTSVVSALDAPPVADTAGANVVVVLGGDAAQAATSTSSAATGTTRAATATTRATTSTTL